LGLRVGRVRSGQAKNAQSAAGDLKPVQHRDVQRIQLDGRVEAVLEVRDDAAAQDGLGVVDDVFGCDTQAGDEQQQEDARPCEPAGNPPAAWRASRVSGRVGHGCAGLLRCAGLNHTPSLIYLLTRAQMVP
jgi:hypothetical protein